MNAIAAVASLIARVASHHLVQSHLRLLARQAGRELINRSKDPSRSFRGNDTHRPAHTA
jgi:hypothetical protein